MNPVRGYILVETIVAMAVLSVSAAAVQQAVYTAVQARGLSQDYTTAQWLLEDLAASASLEPRLADGDVLTGTFPAPYDRFEFTRTVEKVKIPLPPLPAGLTPEQVAALEASYQDYLGRVRIEIRWFRGGQPFSIVGETLIAPGRLWLDPRDEDAP